MKEENLKELCERSGYSNNLSALEDVLSDLPALSASGPWLAGGSLRRLLLGTNPLESDLDFFFCSEAQADSFSSSLAKVGFVSVFRSANSETFARQEKNRRIVVQAVRLAYFQTLDEALDAFDFTICQFGFDGTRFIAGNHSLWDLGRKRLVVHRVTFATATVRRLIKYTKQGFTVCNGAVKTILEAVAEDSSLIRGEIEYVD